MKKYIDDIKHTEEERNSSIINQIISAPDYPNFHQIEVFIGGKVDEANFVTNIYIMADSSSIEIAKRTYVKLNCSVDEAKDIKDSLQEIAEVIIATISKNVRGVENPPIHTMKVYINGVPYKEVYLLDE